MLCVSLFRTSLRIGGHTVKISSLIAPLNSSIPLSAGLPIGIKCHFRPYAMRSFCPYEILEILPSIVCWKLFNFKSVYVVNIVVLRDVLLQCKRSRPRACCFVS